MRMNHKPVRWWLFTSALLLVSLSCTTLFPGTSRGLTGTSSVEEQISTTFDCQRLDYPCSLAETAPERLARSIEMLDLAEAAYLESDDMLAAGRLLADEEEIVELAFDQDGLWFRVEGAPPMWLWDFDQVVDIPPNQSTSTNREAFLAKPRPQDSGPIGEQTPGREPQKRARLLLPWAYTMRDDSGELASLLAEHRNYQCPTCIDPQVTREDPKQSEPDEAGYFGPGLDRFMDWADFDLIYVYSHGRQWCGLPDEATGGYFIEGQARPIDDCAGMLTTGRFRRSIFDNASTLDTPGVAWGHKPGDDWWIEALSPDFFRANYQGGLEDSILFFNTCQLLRNDSFSSVLTGPDTAVFGWTQSVRVSRGVATAGELFKLLVDDGLRVETAFEKAKESEGYNTEDTYAGAELDLHGDDDKRAVEIVSWLHPVYDQELEQVGSLPVEGVPDDGQNDQVLARLRVDGIDEDQDPGAFQIHLKIGDQELSDTLAPDTQVDDYAYEITDLIDLNFAVSGREELPFEAWIDLPEGGQTRHFLEDEKLASCGWTGTLSGTQSGDVKGDIALNFGDFDGIDPAQLQALVDQGLMDSVPAIPDMGPSSELPDLIFLTGEDAYPALVANSLGGAFLLQGLNNLGFPTTQENALSFSEQTDQRFAGSINATLIDPINQGNISVNADFIWNAGSFCDINLILEAAKQNAGMGEQ